MEAAVTTKKPDPASTGRENVMTIGVFGSTLLAPFGGVMLTNSIGPAVDVVEEVVSVVPGVLPDSVRVVLVVAVAVVTVTSGVRVGDVLPVVVSVALVDVVVFVSDVDDAVDEDLVVVVIETVFVVEVAVVRHADSRT